LPPISTDTETGTPAGRSASTMLILLFLHCAVASKGSGEGWKRLSQRPAGARSNVHPSWHESAA
jgi:hypothetical protein